ncbi:hypothetical protein BLOT_011297 [Blomia tropicalis]|nr:hypothetical protein BLOT_011297 [Blomia tropicalis]
MAMQLIGGGDDHHIAAVINDGGGGGGSGNKHSLPDNLVDGNSGSSSSALIGGGSGGENNNNNVQLLPTMYNINSDIICNFAINDCAFENDYYDDSLFRYDYNEHFRSKLWFIDRSRSKRFINRGWGRLMSPTYDNAMVHVQSIVEACMLLEFEFDSEGTDQLIVSVQEADHTRTILDYMHQRPHDRESLLLRKYVGFTVTGPTIRIFVQLSYDTIIVDGQYGLRTLSVMFRKCPKKDFTVERYQVAAESNLYTSSLLPPKS